MQFDRQSKMRDIRAAKEAGEFSVEDAAELFATPFDPCTQSLVNTLQHLGMSQAEYEHLLGHASELMEKCTDVGDDEKTGERTVEEMEPITMLSDLVLIGLLAWQLFENRDSSGIEAMKQDIVDSWYNDMLKSGAAE